MVKGLAAAALMAGSLFVAGPAEARGCIRGAIVGGVAGHFAGHHGVLGAAAGCAVGHHYGSKQRQAPENGDPNSANAPNQPQTNQ